jgi:acyl carrier protein
VTRDEIRDEVERILSRLVPGADFSRVAADASLRRTLAVDSMDVLNFVTALQEQLGVDVPERDYQQLDTLEGCVDYLVRAIGGGKARSARYP